MNDLILLRIYKGTEERGNISWSEEKIYLSQLTTDALKEYLNIEYEYS